MATYIPNATQTTEPVESRTVESAALEFRTLKASINGRIEDVQTQNNAQDVRIQAIEAALLAIGEGGLPGTVYVQRFSGTGAQTVFTLDVSVPTSALIDIFISGSYQNKNTFTIVDDVLTFSEAPPAGTDNVEVVVSITIANVETDASLVSFRATDSTVVVRTAQDKMRERVSVKDFGAVGDGVADDTVAIQNAINAATAVGKNLYAPKGTYKLTTQLQVTCGLIGDGSSNTIFQAVNNGTAAGWSILITGGSLFEGFTTDGACSADPVSWDSGNFDSFTGWRPFFMSGINGCVVRDVIGQNSALGAPIRIESCQDIIVENCQAIRGRGNFGDGFYTRRSRRVNFVNCRAYDVTRIGFVCEGAAGGVIQVSEQVAFTCCHAEYAHDQSISYGGGEINAGFWFENSTLTTCTDCTTKNTGDRGFTYAGTALVGTAGFHVCQAHYINCHADGSNTGFSLFSLTPSVPALVTADNCSAINSVQDFSVSYGKFLLNHCSSRKDGGGDQSRAVTAGTDAEVYINNFFEHWTNKPAYLTDPAVDAGSVGKFSVNHPKRIVIDNYTTYDGAALSLKLRVATAITDLSIRNSRFFSAVARLGSINVANCVVDYSTIHPQTNLFVTGTKMLGRFYVVDDAAGALKRIATCEFSRSNEADYLLEFFSGNDIPKPLIFVSNCNFNGNLEIGNKFVRVGSSTVTASSPRAHDIYVDGCTLYNTGDTTANVGIELTRADDASRAYVTSTWKSSTITTIATRTATNSTFENV